MTETFPDQGGSVTMPGAHLGWSRLMCLVVLSAMTLLPGLGASGRLTYHEAFVAQGAREILGSGNWAYPTIGGMPWLEKPPMPWWLVVVVAQCVGYVNETVARLPSAVAAIGLVLGVSVLGTRHYGPRIGLLAGAIQATTGWTVLRGRLAEADILLACLITWTLVAFDRVLAQPSATVSGDAELLRADWHFWRWVFFVLLGVSGLVKGIAFGAILILTVVSVVLLWRWDFVSFRRLCFRSGWILAVVIGISWPLLMVALHGYDVLGLWTTHIADRLVVQVGPGPFAGESWQEYLLSLLGQALPWTPLALTGAGSSLVRALLCRDACRPTVSQPIAFTVVSSDRLLCAWAFVPLALLTFAPIKNAHYAISSQVPWSIWAALTLMALGQRCRFWFSNYGSRALIRAGQVVFILLALAYGLGFWLVRPCFDHRGVEWAFYEAAGRRIPVGVPLVLVYDDWDRNPYASPFGLIPHDLAVRLFYLGHPACWHLGPNAILAHDHTKGISSSIGSLSAVTGAWAESLAVIGRDRDLPVLAQLGDIQMVMQGPTGRSDRTYALFRVTSDKANVHRISRGVTGPIY